MSLEEYYEKRKLAQEIEASELTNEYRKVYGKDPSEYDLREFFWLFTNSLDSMPLSWKSMLRLVGNYSESVEALTRNNPKYPNMKDFLEKLGA